MTALFQKLVHVLPDERGKVLRFALFAALLQAGVAIGLTAADSLFLTHLGAGRLPVVYLGMPVVMAVYAPVYSLLLARVGIDRLVQLTLAALVAGGVAFGAASGGPGEPPAWLLYAGKFYAGMWFIALYTLFWNFADGYFSLRDGKRVYGIIAAGGSLGGIIGAGAVATLTVVLPPARMYFAWSLCAALTFPAFASLRRRYAAIETESHEESEAAAPRQVLRAVFKAFGESRFALGVTILCFAAVALTGMMEFLSMGVLSEGRDAAAMARLLGGLQAVAYVFTLIINLVLFGRIVGWLGVPNTALVLPVSYLAAFGLLFLHPGPVAAMAAFYAYQSLLPGIDYNNVNLLFNAVPARTKPLLRTFVEAMAEPLATAFAGLLLLSLATRLGAHHLALAGLCAAGGALAVALAVRHYYVGALADNLRRDWLNFADTRRDWSGGLGARDLALIREKAQHGSLGEQRVAGDLLWRARDPEARPVLCRLLSAAGPGDVARLRPAIELLLAADDPDNAAATRCWLAGRNGPTDPDVLDEFTAAGLVPPRRVESWQQATDAEPGGATAVPQWQCAPLDEDTLAQIREMLAGNARERSWAIRALGDFQDPRCEDELLPYLADPESGVRTEALRTLSRLASPVKGHIGRRVLPLLGEATAEQRRLILRLAWRLGPAAPVGALLREAESFTAAESRALEATIVELGRWTVPEVREVLRDPSVGYHGRSVAARALSRLDLAAMIAATDELLAAELARAQEHILSFCALEGADPVHQEPLAVLARHHRDAAMEGVEFGLELLSRAGRLPDFDLIRASLSSTSARDRANTVEAIQQSCPRALFRRILGVLEPAGPATGARGLPAAEAIVRRAAESSVALERVIARAELARGSDAASVAHVARIAALLRSAWFGTVRVRTLDYLARHTHLRPAARDEEIYQRGAAVDPQLYVVAAGVVELARPGRTTVAPTGAVFGERVLMLDRERSDSAVSRGATLLVVPAATVVRAIEIFPSLGISLFRAKTVSAVL